MISLIVKVIIKKQYTILINLMLQLILLISLNFVNESYNKDGGSTWFSILREGEKWFG